MKRLAMKRYLTLVLCAVMCVAAHARKYNYRFADTPLAEALLAYRASIPNSD